MTLRHLRICVEVCRLGSVTRAAEQLHLTQPAVSRAIQELEQYYNVRLFDRLQRRLVMTGAGRALYGQAAALVDSFEQIEASLHDAAHTAPLRVGCGVTIGNCLMPTLAKKLAAAYPQTRVEVTVAGGGRLVQGLLDNTLDLALIENMVDQPLLEITPFSHDQLVLALPKGHPLAEKPTITLADVAACPLLLREEGSSLRDYLAHVFAVRGLPLRPLWQSTSTQALLNAAAAGLGVCLLPQSLAPAGSPLVLRTLADEPLQRRYYAAYRKGKHLPAPAETLLAEVKEL